MPNTLLTINQITREAVEIFVNSNAFIKNIDRQFDDEFGKSGAKIGSQLRIRLPNDYTVADGPGLSIQDTSEQYTVLTMATQKNVGISFATADLLLSLDDYAERIILPAMNNLAGKVATTVMQGVEGGISNIVANVDGANNILTPNSGTYLIAGARLADNSAPTPNHRIINDPWTQARVVQSLSGLLNPGSAISEQYYEGVMYRALGFTWFMDQTVIKHTAGTFTAGTVASAGQTGTTLTTNAITGTLLAGDIINIAGVNAVNRVNKQSTGMLQQFVIVTSVATAATSLSIYPAIIPPVGGNDVQYETVTASPALNATISLFTLPGVTYRKNFAYAPQLITLATGELPLPQNVVASRARYDNISIRIVTDYMIATDQEPTRVDVLFGYLFVRPEWGCIVADAV
jgi:hypothetical protein